jgi:hypothetical protein
MKRIFTIVILVICAFISNVSFAQDTIVAWTFPSGSADSLVDKSTTLNSARYLSAQYGTWGTPSYHSITINYTTNGSQGSPDKCAQATGWDNGADSTYWMVKFKTTGWSNMKLYSKQQAGGTNAGPRDFKAQYKLPGSTSPWVDLSTIVCANNWTAGVVNGIDIPAECNNQASQISIRWKMTSNIDINGGTVAATGISKLDDIVVTGTIASGIEQNESSNFISIYPNPNKGSFTIENMGGIKTVKAYNLIGKCVYEASKSIDNKITLNGFSKGLYIIAVTTSDDDQYNYKIIVE